MFKIGGRTLKHSPVRDLGISETGSHFCRDDHAGRANFRTKEENRRPSVY